MFELYVATEEGAAGDGARASAWSRFRTGKLALTPTRRAV